MPYAWRFWAYIGLQTPRVAKTLVARQVWRVRRVRKGAETLTGLHDNRVDKERT